MKKILIMLLMIAGSASAADMSIPWADNSGGTESQHIAAQGQDLNAQHQSVTQTAEGTWATGTGSIHSDEAALASNKPTFAGDPSLMPHQG